MKSSPAPAAETAVAAPSLTVVGIGASAGGLKALQHFVAAIPADSGMAYVVIVHLDPERPSRMSELLQDQSQIPVMQVDRATPIEANRIYIIPPRHDLALAGDMLLLRERGDRSDHAPVDLLFRTLAEVYGQNAVGVVLSGTGADGTAGVRYIRQAGGVTVVQSPDESEYDGMPSSAMATGLVDLVLPSSSIPAELVRLHRLPTRPEGEVADEHAEASLARIFSTLNTRTGHDFTSYKRSTVLRRLDRRLRFNGAASLAEYLPLLQSSTAECQALLRDLLISVSSFFRDPETFVHLESMLPALFGEKGGADTIRTWVVGCATGEEVYSLAMLLAEYAGTLADPPRLQLFATDIDEHGYTWARAGLYSPAAVANISPERLARFFTKEPGGYRVVKSVRELVLFAGHNVLHDPPFSRMDLVSCRNLFIYLVPEAQQRVLETFHFSLNPGGTLMLGASETAGDSGLFGPAVSGHRIFSRNGGAQRGLPRVSSVDPKVPAVAAGAVAGAGGHGAVMPRGFSYGAQHVRMVEQYAPASVIVDDAMQVVHVSASAGRFLRLKAGEPGRNLLDFTSGDLQRVLRTALDQALRKGLSTSRGVVMELDGQEQQVTVHVRPSEDEQDDDSRFALVLFEPVEAWRSAAAAAASRGPEVEVEEELRRTRQSLEAASVAHDETVAELQTVNEELRSINEEQKAATEELETGREEIQSINEELTTINQEHQSTIEELKRTNGDLQNLIESTEIGTIFLDRNMRIRRFTPAVTNLFNFVGADQGRRFSDITHRLDYDSLVADVTSVLESLQRTERHVTSDTGETYVVRINPYRSVDGGPDGVVLTFFDNSVQHRIEDELRLAKITAESANLAKGTFLSTLSHEFRTPLNGIIGYADLLQMDGELTESQAVKVDRIKVGGWHLVSLIDEILSFAKLDGGREHIDTHTLDAVVLAREAAALIEPSAAAKGLAFILDLPESPVALTTDAGKARQILMNLCGNAVKYTFEGQIRLRVVPGDERVTFEVRDTGIGIAAEHHGRIFDRFWQVDGAATRAAGGMGIGLAAAREYARLLRGDVEVESEPGGGTTFRLWLPLHYDRR